MEIDDIISKLFKIIEDLIKQGKYNSGHLNTYISDQVLRAEEEFKLIKDAYENYRTKTNK